MSHRNHRFTTGLTAAPAHAHDGLPGRTFGALIGTFDHATLSAHDGTKQNPNHLYLWLKVESPTLNGLYEVAFNVRSKDDNSPDLFSQRSQVLADTDIPAPGFFSPASLSFADLGLQETDFHNIPTSSLESQVRDYAGSCDLMAAYGITYQGGDGIDQIHMNSGERAGSPHPNLDHEDGALIFYWKDAEGSPRARWLFIKFRTQDL